MANAPSQNRKLTKKRPQDLNIMPIMNMFLVIIPMLLTLMVTVNLAMLAIDYSASSNASANGAGKGKDKKKEKGILTLKIMMDKFQIDFGLKKTGFAIADGNLSEPYVVFRHRDVGVLKKRVREIVQKEKIEKIVVGISENRMAEKTRRFWKGMKNNLAIPIVFQDETLSTKKAQMKSIEAGVGRKKRKEMEDAYAAALILQDYLDNY